MRQGMFGFLGESLNAKNVICLCNGNKMEKAIKGACIVKKSYNQVFTVCYL